MRRQPSSTARPQAAKWRRLEPALAYNRAKREETSAEEEARAAAATPSCA